MTLSFAEIVRLHTGVLSKESQQKVEIIKDIAILGQTYDKTWQLTTEHFDNLYDDTLDNLQERFRRFDYTLTRLISIQAKIQQQHV